MRILYLLQDFPYPATDGVRHKPYNLLSYMARRHECHVLSFGRAADRALVPEWEGKLPGLKVLGLYEDVQGRELLQKRVRAAWAGLPLSVARWNSSPFRAAVQRALRDTHYDLVHIDMVNLGQYLPEIRGLPTVFSINDASSRLYPQLVKLTRNPLRRQLIAVLGQRLLRYEISCAALATRVHVVSSMDAAHLMDLVPGAQIDVIAITLDETYLRLDPGGDNERTPSILSVALINSDITAAPMLEFLDRGFPRIQQRFPGCVFNLLARNVPKNVLAATSRPGVALTRWVDDYPRTMQEATIALFLDVAGSGMKNRVVQAMGAAKAVVGTPTAFEGIPVVHGHSGFVCDSVEEATYHIMELLADGLLRETMGMRARALARERFSPTVIGSRWEDLYAAARSTKPVGW